MEKLSTSSDDSFSRKYIKNLQGRLKISRGGKYFLFQHGEIVSIKKMQSTQKLLHSQQ
jgi:hypothetical protein